MADAANFTFLTIPAVNNLPWVKFRISLSGTIYTLHLRYNSRSQRWLIDINDSQDNQIISGLPILINRNVSGQYTTLSLPAGVIFATDDTNQDVQPTLLSFGLDHTLWYADPGST
jgi:hypothetical protein